MEIEIPKNCALSIEGESIRVKSGAEEEVVKFNSKKLNVALKDGKIVISTIRKSRRRTSSMINSISKHLRNFFNGITTPYEKKLQVIYAHFPISVEVKGSEVQIKNFLGEKQARKARVMGRAQVIVKGQDITVKGSSAEAVGQTAANIMQAVKIIGKDRRVFQDGIYLV